MPSSRPRFLRKAEIVRLLAAAREGGIDPAGIELSPEGGIRIIEARAIPSQPNDEFSKWEGRL